MTLTNNNDNSKKQSTKRPSGRGLGRGLDALFGDDEDSYTGSPASPSGDESQTGLARKIIGIEKIIADANQPRKYFDDDALKSLAESIAQYGLLQPIIVRPSQTQEGCFEIVAGERRWRASQKAQLHEVPVVIRDLNESDTFQIAMVENLQRQDLTPIEEAKGYAHLAENFNQSHEGIGKFIGKSRSHIANMIRLLELPSAVQTMVELGDISAGHARALLKADEAQDLALQVVEKNLSVRDTEKLVAEQQGRNIQRRKASSKIGQEGFAKKDPNILDLERQVSNNLGFRVTIDMKPDNQAGRMSIDFKDLGQLDDVLKRLENPSLV